MPVNKVKKVNLIIHDSIYEEVISKLQESGIIHVDEVLLEKIEKELNLSKNELFIENDEKLKHYISIIDKLFERVKLISVEFQDKEKEELLTNFVSKIETFSKSEFYRLIENFNYEKVLNEINDLLEKEKNLNNEIEKDRSRINALKPISNLSIPLEYLKDTEYCAIHLFVISKSKYNQFVEEIDNLEIEKLYSFYEISEYENNIFFILLSHKNIYQTIYQTVKKYGGEEYSISELNGTISENIIFYEKNIDKNILKIKEIHNTIFEIIKVYGKSIKAFYDDIFARFAKEKVEQKFLTTQTTKLLAGWVLEKDVDNLIKLLDSFDYIIYSLEDPKEDEEPPVLLVNKKIAEPFESLTELYSLPKYNEIDPTPLIAPIYPILFGICLGDAGYGLILFFATLFLSKKYKTEKLIKVLFQGSIWTIVFGILTGTYFGTRLDLLRLKAPALVDFIEKFIWFDPLKNPMKFFVLALQIGIVEMSYSFLVAFYTQIKSKDFYKAYTQTLPYFFITVCGSLLVSTIFGFKLPVLIINILFFICALSAASLLIFSANSEKTAFEKGIGKFFALYNIAGIMGDILSFSRLLALGLSSSVIATVANIIAEIFRGKKFNPITWLFSLVALLALHGINFALGILGSFVHSMRLQFVEFFKNFYEGGGRKWSPFKRVHRYSNIVK